MRQIKGPPVYWETNVHVQEGAVLEDCVVLPDVVIGPGVGLTLITPEMLGQRVHPVR